VGAFAQRCFLPVSCEGAKPNQIAIALLVCGESEGLYLLLADRFRFHFVSPVGGDVDVCILR
jgi:hypothetical protein